MSRKLNLVGISFLLVVFACALTGCGSAQKMTPHLGFGDLRVETQIGRGDIVVLDRVEGSSTLTSILFGCIQIIDGDKLQLLGFKFFKDKYTYFKDTGGHFASCADRAYYKALEAAPEADCVFQKSMDYEDAGIPLLWSTQAVTFKGKAVKVKTDE